MPKNTVLDSLIINLVQTHSIREQSELQKLLNEQSYDIPQATLSRCLKKLKIAKVNGVYQLVEFNLPTTAPILNIQISEFGLIVLHTYPGHAGGLAYLIDQKYKCSSFSTTNAIGQFGILGTIAGNDTVLLIIRSHPEVTKVVELLKKDFQTLPLSDSKL